MKLTLKCLIDFRSWLGENHDMRMWEFNELPEFVQNAYYREFLNINNLTYDNETIELKNEIYNNNFQKELDESLVDSN